LRAITVDFLTTVDCGALLSLRVQLRQLVVIPGGARSARVPTTWADEMRNRHVCAEHESVRCCNGRNPGWTGSTGNGLIYSSPGRYTRTGADLLFIHAIKVFDDPVQRILRRHGAIRLLPANPCSYPRSVVR
jgi:hypothetical protein